MDSKLCSLSKHEIPFLRVDQLEKLRALSQATETPVAEYIKQGIDVILNRQEFKNFKYDIARNAFESSPNYILDGPPTPFPLPKDPLFPFRDVVEGCDGYGTKQPLTCEDENE